MITRVNTIVTLFFILILVSCSNTQFTSVWAEKDYRGKPIGNIMVIGIGKNKMARRMFEDNFVSELENEGITAIASYKHIPEDVSITRESVDKAIKGKSIDAVILTHLLAIDEETVYNPPVSYVTSNVYYGHYYSYYPTVNHYVQSPGYYSTNKLVKLETNLYETSTAALIWSAQSSTFNPDTAKDVINPLIKLVIKDLKKRKLLAQIH